MGLKDCMSEKGKCNTGPAQQVIITHPSRVIYCVGCKMYYYWNRKISSGMEVHAYIEYF